jgi:hypothetical protein
MYTYSPHSNKAFIFQEQHHIPHSKTPPRLYAIPSFCFYLKVHGADASLEESGSAGFGIYCGRGGARQTLPVAPDEAEGSLAQDGDECLAGAPPSRSVARKAKTNEVVYLFMLLDNLVINVTILNGAS